MLAFATYDPLFTELLFRPFEPIPSNCRYRPYSLVARNPKKHPKSLVPIADDSSNFRITFPVPSKFDPKDLEVKLDAEKHELSVKLNRKWNSDNSFQVEHYEHRCKVPANLDLDQLKCRLEPSGKIAFEAPLVDEVQLKKAIEDKAKAVPVEAEKEENKKKELTTWIEPVECDSNSNSNPDSSSEVEIEDIPE